MDVNLTEVGFNLEIPEMQCNSQLKDKDFRSVNPQLSKAESKCTRSCTSGAKAWRQSQLFFLIAKHHTNLDILGPVTYIWWLPCRPCRHHALTGQGGARCWLQPPAQVRRKGLCFEGALQINISTCIIKEVFWIQSNKNYRAEESHANKQKQELHETPLWS